MTKFVSSKGGMTKNYEKSCKTKGIRVAIRLAQMSEGNCNKRNYKQKDRNAPPIQAHLYSGYRFKLIASVSVVLKQCNLSTEGVSIFCISENTKDNRSGVIHHSIVSGQELDST